MRSTLTRTTGILVPAALLALLTGCQPDAPAAPGDRPGALSASGRPAPEGLAGAASRPAGAAGLPTPAGSLPVPAGSLPVPTGSLPPVGTGEGGPGSLTVAFTQPVAFTGHVDTPVSCSTANRTYTASASSATIGAYQVSFTVKAAPYKGPGTYPAVVTLDITGLTSATVPGVPTTITDAGGSVSVSATGENGRTVDVTLQWACS